MARDPSLLAKPDLLESDLGLTILPADEGGEQPTIVRLSTALASFELFFAAQPQHNHSMIQLIARHRRQLVI